MKHRKQYCKTWFLRSIAVYLSAVLTLCLAGCRRAENKTRSCFIYTDGLLDDLCAMEYLSQHYDQAVIMLAEADGLKDSPLSSASVKDRAALLETASGWFRDCSEYREGSDLTGMDLYLFAPLTEFVLLMENDESIRDSRVVLMAGESDGPEGAGNEWNAAADEAAYRYVISNLTHLSQVSSKECEARFAEQGYPYHARFLDEYRSRMEALQENLCCYDLQAAAAD